VRPLDSLDARFLAGTEGADFPFWSPDSKSIGFFAQDKLKRVDLSGGSPAVLADVVFGAAGVGGAWTRDGVIVFADKRGLFRIADSGGIPAALLSAEPPESGFGYPQFMPDGKHLLFFVASNMADRDGLYVTSLDQPKSRSLVLKTSSKAVFAPALPGQPARVVFLRERSLLTQSFDTGKLRPDGDPSLVAEDVAILPALRASAFWMSDTGVIAYRSGLAFDRVKLVWRDREGRRHEDAAPENAYSSMRLSPDGKRIAIGRREPSGPSLIWMIDYTRGVTARLAEKVREETRPAWSHDGRYIAFSSPRNGVYQLFRIAPDGTGSEEQLTDGPGDKYLSDWSRDGKYLLYTQGSPGAFDLMARALPAGPESTVLRTPFDEMEGQFSPDGKWIAYSSNASGRYEIYVLGISAGINAPTGRFQISSGGGHAPRWRGDGQELFYLQSEGNHLMAVKLHISGQQVQAETPRELFHTSVPADSGDNPFPYDVTEDGKRFLMLETAGTQSSIPLTVVVNWQASMKK
jgi:Tol biopolymer transport system component